MVNQDLKWTEYVLNDQNCLVKILGNRVNALRLVSNVASFITRKKIADGIFMRKLIYMIQVWGGCEKYLLQSLQTIQNKAARAVVRLEAGTPTRTILSQCGWLSIRQLVTYHSTVLVHRVKLSRVPQYLYDMYNFDERLIGTREAGLKGSL